MPKALGPIHCLRLVYIPVDSFFVVSRVRLPSPSRRPPTSLCQAWYWIQRIRFGL